MFKCSINRLAANIVQHSIHNNGGKDNESNKKDKSIG